MAVATETNPAEALAERLFNEAVGSLHFFNLYIGVRLGLFRALTEGDSLTAAELADATRLDPWYVREWLQAETIAGVVGADVEDLAKARFTAIDGVRENLVDELNPMYIGGLPYVLPAVGKILPALIEAFRTGGGVAYKDYGEEALIAQATLNRPAFVNLLASEWIPAIPDVADRLADAARPATVADVGCGYGWSSIELAKAFPQITVDGYDSDEASIRAAEKNALEHGVTDRVTFSIVDAESGLGGKRYDLVTFFECVHDMSRPVEVLAAARAALAENGTVVVMDERVGEKRPEPGSDPVEIMFSAFSVLWCLPQSRVEPGSESPGTVMRPATFEGIALRAGFSGVEILPIEHPFWRFYRLQTES